MKKKKLKIFTAIAFLLIFIGVAYAADYSWHREGKATLGKDGRSWKQIYLGGSSSAAIVFEGTTSDAYETTLTTTDTTLTDKAITLPDYSGSIPLTVSIGTATTTVATTTRTDITGTSVTLPASFFDSQERLEWIVEGDITGTNGNTNFALYVSDDQTTTTTVPIQLTGAFVLNCSLTAISVGNEISRCGVEVNGATTTIETISSLIKDLSSGGTVKLQISAASASDFVSVSTTQIMFKY